MWLVTVKGLLAHKLRLAMTALAVILGVAFVAGSFILTDTIERSFQGVINDIAGGIDLQVRPEGTGADFEAGFSQERATVPATLLDEVRDVEGVALADAVVSGQAQVIDADGQPVGGMGPPTLGLNAPTEEGFAGIEVREGRLPTSRGEVALDAFTVRTQGLEVGSAITILAGGPLEEVTLVGSVGFGAADNLAGATVLLFAFDEALERFSPTGDYDQIEILVEDGAELATVADRVASVVSDGVEVVTSEQLVEENTEAVAGVLGVFSTALLAFAGVALFVGVFIIVNTFSITVAQRVREFALLRAIGAGRRQIMTSVLVEAGVLGLLGGLVGLALGVLLAIGLRALLAAFGLDLPAEGLLVLPRTIVVGLVVGLVVTVAAAIAPALRATRIAPVQALQSAAVPTPARRGWGRLVAGSLVTLIGVVLLVIGLVADGGVAALGGGAGAVFIGVALLSPLLARPVVSVLGLPIARLLGIRGELARENAMRNPRRTATTASALMVGVGLVGFVGILGASLTASLGDAVDEVYRLDLDVRSTTFQAIPAAIGDDLAALGETELALTQRLGQFELDDAQRFLFGVDTDRVTDIYAIEVTEGSLDELAAGGIALSESAAERDGVGLGDALQVRFPATGEATLDVRAIYDGRSIDVDYMIDTAFYREFYVSDEVFAIGVLLADGVSPEDGQGAVDAALAAYPGVVAMDRTAVRENLTAQVDQVVGLVYGLLGLAIVIAFVGIVNTLALSVFERVRELGLLRAVGMSRRQVRSMIRWESVLISVLGVTLGLGVGLFFGWLLVQALQDDFPLRLVIPTGQLALAVVIAVVAGVLAGVLPARRAARVDVLRAVTTD
ncbi:MAG: ABC transporter permease [Nitriliruptoraceae bacterium]|nr:ABC transporter permease [Nitriliruptoraceae bacterium]